VSLCDFVTSLRPAQHNRLHPQVEAASVQVLPSPPLRAGPNGGESMKTTLRRRVDLLGGHRVSLLLGMQEVVTG
jgi:hypothetical protein